MKRQVAYINNLEVVEIQEFDTRVVNLNLGAGRGLVDVTFHETPPVVGDKFDDDQAIADLVKEDPIYWITPSALQRRLTIAEETFIVDTAPTEIRIVYQRAMNASYIDLTLDEVKGGMSALADALVTQGMVGDKAAWLANILRWGSEEEASPFLNQAA